MCVAPNPNAAASAEHSAGSFCALNQSVSLIVSGRPSAAQTALQP